MKNLKNLGQALSKAEQREVNGGKKISGFKLCFMPGDYTCPLAYHEEVCGSTRPHLLTCVAN